VVDTNGSIAETDSQVAALMERLKPGSGIRDSGSAS